MKTLISFLLVCASAYLGFERVACFIGGAWAFAEALAFRDGFMEAFEATIREELRRLGR